MIDPATIERIYDAADIVDVVKDFVNLKKRGANYIGLCPFHNEKTPSFSVSATKGIFKCFGCGKGGNSVNFIMEQEHLTYVESLKYLAKKYHIEIEERELSPEEKQHQSDRESLMVVSAFAQRYFSETLFQHPEGKAIGLSYFHERGFREDIIKKFELGYCPDQRDSFSQAALKEGYKKEFLEKSGLSIVKETSIFDRFSARVMFPIHSLSGKVVGFGGRTLRTDKNVAKYINSPESEIYHKSSVLYGFFQARKAIEQADKCFLVEGYTDVLSMYQAGIENVVASSGTSLTPDQIRLIKRFTPNITVLYDGDDAGIKASIRGIDLILEEGLSVKVVLLPDKEDPDSYSKKVSLSELKQFLKENEQDFIHFKVRLLLDEAKDDPVKRANLIVDIVRSIGSIRERISRDVYIKDCSSLLKVNEEVLYKQLNSLQRKSEHLVPIADLTYISELESNEKEITRLLIMYGNHELAIEKNAATGERQVITAAQIIIEDLLSDEQHLIHPIYSLIFDECAYLLHHNLPISEKHFIQHPDEIISKVAADIISSQRPLSKIYAKNEILVETEDLKLNKIVSDTLITFKSKKIKIAIKETTERLIKAEKGLSEEDTEEILRELDHFNTIKRNLSKSLGNRIII